MIPCKDQNEIDYYWNALTTNGGEESVCGWLKDKFGVSWQVVPSALNRLLQDKDPNKAKRVMAALLKMSKIDIQALEQA
jgi:predicted 3-demethylubiquinone-9 3-methyltransferase (glyoxalase superfamily)